MIGIIDYGMGNLSSVKNALDFINAESVISEDVDVLKSCDGLILPGVGAFPDAIKRLKDTGLDIFIKEYVKERPLIGICLGMQLLFDKSFEYGEHDGLGLIPGEVRPLTESLPSGTKVPHMGWNSLSFPKESPLFKYVSEGESVYYVHSYYAVNCTPDTVAVSDYCGVSVTGAVQRGKVFGTQFHPEKSGKTGLAILKAFTEV